MADFITTFQREIIDECKQKQNGGLALPMGSGKTLIGIQLALELLEMQCDKTRQILVICSKTLISSWVHEIKKFFDNSLEYQVVLNNPTTDNSKILFNPNARIILTTPQVLCKGYTLFNLKPQFTKNLQRNIIEYVNPSEPMLSNIPRGFGMFYSRTFACLLVDEAQNFTNITTATTQAIACVHAQHRWLLSGTMFSEPKTPRILGFFCLLDAPNTPRTLPATEELIRKNPYFRGLDQYTVKRTHNENFKNPPELVKHIVEHTMTLAEEQIYLKLKDICHEINQRIRNSKLARDHETTRLMNSFLMAMVTYTRQCIVTPTLPIASAFLNLVDHKNNSELSQLIIRGINSLELSNVINNVDFVKSSRIKTCLQTMAKHANEKIVIFSCFRTNLDMIRYYIEQDFSDRPVFTIESSHSSERRYQCVNEYQASANGILLLTYEIGSVGLNLQTASVVLILDLWWNNGTTEQSIARVFRYGQKNKVNVYFFTSNTGIENIIFKKQSEKLLILNDLKTGCIQRNHSISTFQTREILKLIDREDNKHLLKKLHI